MYTLVNFSTASNTTTGIGPQFVVSGPNMRINDGGVVSDSTSVSLARLQTAYDTADAWAEVVVDELDGESDIGVIIRTTSSGLDADSKYYFARMNNGKLQLLSKTTTGTGLSGVKRGAPGPGFLVASKNAGM